jgi:uncharacterized protein HemX
MEEEAKSLISDLMDRISGSEEKSSSSTPAMLILLGLLVLVVSVLGIKLAWAKRKAAELAVQVRRAEEEKKRAEENAKMAENSAARQTAQQEADALGKDIDNLKSQIAQRHEEQKELVSQLNPVTSWDDIVVIDGRNQ